MSQPAQQHRRKRKPSVKDIPLDIEEFENSPTMAGMWSILETPPQVYADRDRKSAATHGTPLPSEAGRKKSEISNTSTNPHISNVNPIDSLTAGPIDSLTTGGIDSLSPDDNQTTGPIARLADELAAIHSTHRPLGKLSMGYVSIQGQLVESRLVRPANTVQDAHTSTEQIVYQNLWNKAAADRTEDFRILRRGYGQIAQDNAISKRNLIRVLESLESKLAIEVIEEAISSDHVAKTYKVWHMKQVLRRRHEAGYSFVYRNRTAVELVRATGPIDSLTTGAIDSLTTGPDDTLTSGTPDDRLSSDVRQTIGSGAKQTTAPVDSLTTHSRSTQEKVQESSTSSSDKEPIRREFHRRFQEPLDDDQVDRIRRECRKRVPDITDEELGEIARGAVDRLAVLTKNGYTQNPPGLLLSVMTSRCTPTAVEVLREQHRHDQDILRALEQDQGA